MKQTGNLLIIAMGIAVGAGGGLLLARSGLINWRPSGGEKLRDLSVASPGAKPPHARGDINAPVTIEEFADFQCPPCNAFHYDLRMIEVEYGSRVRVIFRNYPLQRIHKNALLAARASEAGDLQGHSWEMHDRLYETQDQWGEATDARQRFIVYARDLQLNEEKFERDLDGEQTAQRVAADYERGQSIEINGTPTIFINGREIPKESVTPKGIRGTIDAALKERSR